MATDNIQFTNKQQTVNALQRQWPQLGKQLYSLERALAAHFVIYEFSLSKNEKRSRKWRTRYRGLKNYRNIMGGGRETSACPSL